MDLDAIAQAEADLVFAQNEHDDAGLALAQANVRRMKTGELVGNALIRLEAARRRLGKRVGLVNYGDDR